MEPKPVRSQCNCPCHKHRHLMHMVECCLPDPKPEVAKADMPIDVSDTLLERVWKVRSDNIQPNVTARRMAVYILAKMEDAQVTPDRIVADPDGGVALYVFGRDSRDDCYGRILAANEGDITALCADYREPLHHAWQVDAENIPDAVIKIHSFILEIQGVVKKP
jgi:hypothetical protein